MTHRPITLNLLPDLDRRLRQEAARTDTDPADLAAVFIRAALDQIAHQQQQGRAKAS